MMVFVFKSQYLRFAKVIRTASEPVLKTVGTMMNRMGIDTSLWRLNKYSIELNVGYYIILEFQFTYFDFSNKILYKIRSYNKAYFRNIF